MSASSSTERIKTTGGRRRVKKTIEVANSNAAFAANSAASGSYAMHSPSVAASSSGGNAMFSSGSGGTGSAAAAAAAGAAGNGASAVRDGVAVHGQGMAYNDGFHGGSGGMIVRSTSPRASNNKGGFIGRRHSRQKSGEASGLKKIQRREKKKRLKNVSSLILCVFFCSLRT
jgi:hypothetical protein